MSEIDSSVSTLPDSRTDEFRAFAARAFPERDYARHCELYLRRNAVVPSGSVILIATAGPELVGQFVLVPLQYWLHGKRHRGYWGCDYFVDPTQRRSGLGGLLALRAIRGHRPYFATSPSAEALEIHLALKTRVIGSLRKFLWLRASRAPVIAGRALFRPRAGERRRDSGVAGSFPERVASGAWERARDGLTWDYAAWRPGVLEWDRSDAFLAWRFFQEPDRYAVYVRDGAAEPAYFAVRRRLWRRLDVVTLVDYRGALDEPETFPDILAAAKRVARELGCDGVLTMSSHRDFDAALCRNGFVGIGQESAVLSNVKLDETAPESAVRAALFATMADSDLEWTLRAPSADGLRRGTPRRTKSG